MKAGGHNEKISTLNYSNISRCPGWLCGHNIAANHPENYSRLVFRQSGEQLSFPVDEFYRTVSGALPSWMVVYFPPGTIIQDGEPLPYPVLYEQGQRLMFKEPDHE
jgi:hypothetical protein